VKSSLLVLALLLAPAPGRAHDLWVEPVDDGFVLRIGHRGGELLPLDAGRVKAIRCASGHAAPADVRGQAHASGPELRVPARCDAVTAFLDGGFHSLTPDGEVSRPKDQVAGAVRSWQSRQYAKWIDPASPGAARALGDELEIVPVTDLGRARAGEKASFRVLLDGRPVAGAAVAVGHRVVGETDREGEVRVKLRAACVETLSASVRRPLATPQADALVLEASLTFPVGR